MKEIAGRYQHERKSAEYIAGEQFDYVWSKGQIKRAERMYTMGYDIRDIADKVRKTEHGDLEVFILLADLICKGKLEGRQGKMFGSEVDKKEAR